MDLWTLDTALTDTSKLYWNHIRFQAPRHYREPEKMGSANKLAAYVGKSTNYLWTDIIFYDGLRKGWIHGA